MQSYLSGNIAGPKSETLRLGALLCHYLVPRSHPSESDRLSILGPISEGLL